MGIFERYLSLWVALCIILGILLGNFIPSVFLLASELQLAQVNIPVAIFIWVMIYPMMVQVDFSSIKDVGKKPKGIVLTLVINWLVKPFTMAALGWLFFRVIFADLVDPATATEYIAGMILLGVAPCTAMVFVWCHLTKGDANYTLVLWFSSTNHYRKPPRNRSYRNSLTDSNLRYFCNRVRLCKDLKTPPRCSCTRLHDWHIELF